MTDRQILDVYQVERSGDRVAKALDIGRTSVYRTLVKHGIVRDGLNEYRVKAQRYDSETAAEIIRLYRSGVKTSALVAKFGGTYYSIKASISRSGGKIRPNPCPSIKDGEESEILRLSAAGFSTIKIASALQRSTAFVTRVLNRNGIFKFEDRRGEKHPSWKGGRWVTPDGGYVMIKVDLDDPIASKMLRSGGYIPEHRLVMARSLGRPLMRHETVHHIDGNKQNNAIENLQLRQGPHGRGAAMRCRDCGSCNIEPVPLSEPED